MMAHQTKALARRTSSGREYMHTDTDAVVVVDLLDLLKALLRKFWVILLVCVLFAGAGYCIAKYVVTPEYESSTKIFVNNNTVTVSSSGSTSYAYSSTELSTADLLVETYIVILQSRTTLEDVIEAAGLDYTYEELLSMITAEAVNDTEIFEITVTCEDPEEAALIANTIAEILPEDINEIVDGSDTRIADYAVAAEEQSSPSNSGYAKRGLILGFVIICLIILARTFQDDVIHNEDDLRNEFSEVPLLGVIPELQSKDGKSSGYI